MSQILVTLDIALNKTGMSIMTTNNSVLSTRIIKVDEKTKYYDKLSELYTIYCELFTAIFQKYKDKSLILVLEGRLKAGFSGSALASIEGARVTVYHAFKNTASKYENSVEVVTYDPNSVKYGLSGKRNADKAYMFSSVSSYFSSLSKLSSLSEDELDAIYLGLYHNKLIEGKNANRRVKKVRKIQTPRRRQK